MTSRPPGLVTRSISSRALRGFHHVAEAEGNGGSVEAVVSERQVGGVTGDEVNVRAAALAHFEHAQGEVAGHYVYAGISVGFAGSSRAGSQVKDLLAYLHIHGVNHDPPPTPRLPPHGQDIIDDVVFWGDIIKHRRNFVRTLFQGCSVHPVIVSDIQPTLLRCRSRLRFWLRAGVLLFHHDEHAPYLDSPPSMLNHPPGGAAVVSGAGRRPLLVPPRGRPGGYGELTRFNATGPERFLEADIWWRHLILEAEITDHVEVPGTGPVAFGSFAFSKTSPHVSRLILPELVVGIRDGRAWATQLTFDDGPLTEAGVLASVDRWLTEPEPNGDGSAAGGSDVGLSPEAVAADGSAGHLSRGSLSEAAWMQAVSNGVEEIRAGKLEKLVLARDVVANLPPEGVNAAEVLRQLAARYRECWTYGVDGLVGATPEMLIQVEGRTAQARVLAGTLDRRDADGMDGSPPWNMRNGFWPVRKSSGTNTRSPSIRSRGSWLLSRRR